MNDHSRLPQRPRIPGHFNIVPMSDGRIQLRSAHKTVLLGGKSIAAVGKLLGLLDGSRQLNEVLSQFPDIPEGEVIETLQRLADRGLVEEAPDPADMTAGARSRDYEAQETLFRLSHQGGGNAQESLGKSHVAVFGLGGVGSHAVMSLARAGIGGITGVDTGVVERWLPAMSALYTPHDAGRPRAEAIAERLREIRPDVRYQARSKGLDEPEDFAGVVGTSSLVLVCMDSPEVAAYRAVNAAALTERVPWLRAAVDGFEAQLGPAVIPGETACYSCYELRTRANWSYYDENVEFEEYLARERPKIGYGGLASVCGFLGNLAALEAEKLLAGFMPPMTCGKFVTFHIATFDFQSHDVMKLPRCPSCGIAALRPKTSHWSLEEG